VYRFQQRHSNFFAEGIDRLVCQRDACLSAHGDYFWCPLLLRREQFSNGWFQASVLVKMRSLIFWHFTQRRLVFADVSGQLSVSSSKVEGTSQFSNGFLSNNPCNILTVIVKNNNILLLELERGFM
jgi:hypothetical protein